jgi:hypothetical protein
MANFDKQKFVDDLRTHVSKNPFGEGLCAKHVRLALASAGLKPSTWPGAAKDWGPTLQGLHFIALPGNMCPVVKLGDIAVIEATSKDAYGHIEAFDGTNWISDFVQREFWPGPSFRVEKPQFAIYRWPF